MLDNKGYSTPMSTTEKLKKDEGTVFENSSLHKSIVGSPQYMLLTRPDIAYIVNKLSQFLAALTIFHQQACKRVSRYLQGITNFGIQFFNSGPLNLTAYFDVDWGSNPNDRQSVSGYCMFLGNNLIFQSSKNSTLC